MLPTSSLSLRVQRGFEFEIFQRLGKIAQKCIDHLNRRVDARFAFESFMQGDFMRQLFFAQAERLFEVFRRFDFGVFFDFGSRRLPPAVPIGGRNNEVAELFFDFCGRFGAEIAQQ